MLPAMQESMGSVMHDIEEIEEEYNSESHGNVKWAHRVKDGPAYRKLEFQRTLKQFKAAIMLQR